ERSAELGSIVRGDEARAFQRAPQHRLQCVVERRVPGTVLEIRNDYRDRIVRLHWRRRPCEPPCPRHETGDERDVRGNHARRAVARLWNWDAVFVQPIEIRGELLRRLIPLLAIRL